MTPRRLSKMLHRTKRRAPAKSSTRTLDAAPFVASPRVLDLTVQAIRAMQSNTPTHHDRTFGSGNEKVWVHLCANNRVELAAPACDGLPAHSAVLTRQEFESMCAWIRCEFDSLAAPKQATPAQPAQFLN